VKFPFFGRDLRILVLPEGTESTKVADMEPRKFEIGGEKDLLGTLGEQDRKVRVSCVQYQMRKIADFDEFAAQVRYFVETASLDYGVDYVLFPEFFLVQLLSGMESVPAEEGIQKLAELAP